MTPANEALAYRIWAFCEPLGWNVSVKDIAEEMGCSWQKAQAVLNAKNWSHRVRRGAPCGSDSPYAPRYRMTFLDGSMDDLNRWSA